MTKLIKITHHLDDYECMWNGIEDLYMNNTNCHIPSQAFFLLSGFGGFVYLHTDKSPMKRMISFGDGRTHKMYEFLSPIVGFDYKFVTSNSAERALSKVKKLIDDNQPVVIGALDMYYLPYYAKLYHQAHIPLHYVLMVGYDDEQKIINIYDCGKATLINLSYQDLFLAWNSSYPGLSKPYTFIKVNLTNPQEFTKIVNEAMTIKINNYLTPITSFMGYKGMKKLADEIKDYHQILGYEETSKILSFTVQFFGTVPTTPKRLLGLNQPEEVVFKGSCDKMSKFLNDLVSIYHNDDLKQASLLFDELGNQFEMLTKYFIAYIVKETTDLQTASSIITTINELFIKVFTLLKPIFESK